jgi:alanine racemase
MRASIRPTVAEVDLPAIGHNLDRLRAIFGGQDIWAVVKADAYGHGAVPVGRYLSGRCAGLAVSLVEEGLELRAAGLTAPILVLGAYYDQCHDLVLANRLTPVVYDPADIERFAEAAGRRGRTFDVHLKIDTGMGRLGVAPATLGAVLDRLRRTPALRLAGLATHFAQADAAESTATDEALARFAACIGVARARGFTELSNHAANTAAAVRFRSARLGAVRPGIGLYGAVSAPTVVVPDLRPALRFATRIMSIRDVPVGGAVSYGGLWRAPRPSRVATLPVGYADGYPRHVTGAETLVRGRRVPIVGAVCMDMMMIDVTDVPDAVLGDEVTLIGGEGPGGISAEQLATWAGTIVYEILCGISKRVPRIYKA